MIYVNSEILTTTFSSLDLRRAHKVHPIAALQVEYSPFVLDIENDKLDLMRTAKELGITIVAYSPLGRGLLTGRYVRIYLLNYFFSLI